MIFPRGGKRVGFRPLAGMSVFPGYAGRQTLQRYYAVSDPLRGCRCFRGTIVVAPRRPWFEFQTPCGDVGVSGVMLDPPYAMDGRAFQTPCGDVGVSGLWHRRNPCTHRAPVSDPLRGCRCFRATGRMRWCAPRIRFQTPCGDVGVSGTSVFVDNAGTLNEFQTPCGDVGVSGQCCCS